MSLRTESRYAVRPLVRQCLYIIFLGVSGHSAAGIENTPHNLIRGNGTPEDAQAICQPCHTPTSSADGADIPRWNGNGQQTPGTYDAETSLGPNIVSGSDGSASMVCLACHDGAQADGVANVYPAPMFEDVPERRVRIGSRTVTVVPGTRVVLTHPGNRLSHPIGVPYGPGGSNTGKRSLLAGEDGYRPVTSGVINDRTVWWVDTGGAGRQKTDIPLYTRGEASGGGATPYIECASCHDPHTENTLFLRVPRAGSRLCLSCHNM